MNNNSSRSIIPAQGNILKDATLRLKLIARLVGDGRVNILSKLLPLGALAYLLWPVDLAPAVVLPIIGTLDDVAILWLGSYLFVEMAPPEVVREHIKRLVSNNAIIDEEIEHAAEESPEDIVDGEVSDVSEGK